MGSLFRRSERGGTGGKWYAEFTDHTGQRVRKSTGTRDKKTAQQILNNWENDTAKRVNGVIDVVAERALIQSRRPLAEHFEEWINSLSAAGAGEDYIGENRSRWTKISEFCNWRSLADITSESLERFIANLRSGPKSKKSTVNRSQRTVGQYVQTAKGFVEFCIATGRLNNSPLKTIKKPNPESDRRLIRRMLLPTEWHRLAAATETGQVILGVAPGERRILYEVAIQTGLRSNELRSLTVANCELTAKPHPFVKVAAKSTKNKNVAKQFVTTDLAKRWSAFLKENGRTGAQPAFQLCSPFYMADMLRRDAAVARAAWISETDDEKEQQKRTESDFLATVNHSGESLDFHALRHTCGAWLAIQNVHPKTIQSVMRHSSITLTLDTYGHLMPGAEAGAIEKLTSMLSGQ